MPSNDSLADGQVWGFGEGVHLAEEDPEGLGALPAELCPEKKAVAKSRTRRWECSGRSDTGGVSYSLVEPVRFSACCLLASAMSLSPWWKGQGKAVRGQGEAVNVNERQ